MGQRAHRRNEYADDQDIEVTATDPGLELAPGWDDVDEDDRDALRAYVDASSLVGRSRTGRRRAEAPDPADYDITINPRFDVKLEGTEFVPAGEQLSVPVSDEAATTLEAPTAEDAAGAPRGRAVRQATRPRGASPIPLG